MKEGNPKSSSLEHRPKSGGVTRGRKAYMQKMERPVGEDMRHAAGETAGIGGITDRSEAEKSRDKYFSLYDFSPSGYVTLDKEGVILEANLTFANMLGVERFRLLSRPLALFLEKSYWDILYFHREKAFSSKKREWCEVQFKKMNGEKFFAQLQTIAVKDQKENYTLSLSAIMDITERKAMEDSLRVAFRELQEIFQVSGDGLLALDENLNILRMNDVFAEVANIKSGKVIGKHYKDVIHEPLYPRIGRAVNEITQGAEYYQTEVEQTSEGGRLAIYRFRAHPFWDNDNHLAGMLIALRNVTEQMEIREAISREQKTLSFILENIDQGVITMDDEGYIIHMNSAAEKYTGIPRKEAVGGHVSDVITLAKERTDYTCVRCLQELANGIVEFREHAPCGKNIFMVCRDGNAVRIEPRCAPIMDEKRAITGATMIFKVIE